MLSDESMWENPKDEEVIVKNLKAFVEEFGPEKVFLRLPAHWDRSGVKDDMIGRVKIFWENIKQVVVDVPEYGIKTVANLRY